MENYELVYIEPSNNEIKNIRELIKTQGLSTCKNKVNIEYISKKTSSFTFGWMSAIPKAQLGRRSIKNINDRFSLNAFVLCSYTPNAPDQVVVELICSVNKIGKLLMELVEDKVKSMGIKKLQLYSLANDKLKKWYESLGYSVYTDFNIGNEEVYAMIKYI
jgi:hypothetical protein